MTMPADTTLRHLLLTITAPSQSIAEAETEADFTASSTSDFISLLLMKERQGLGHARYAKLHVSSNQLFGKGLANTMSLWFRNFQFSCLIPPKAAVNEDSSISLSSVNGCLDV